MPQLQIMGFDGLVPRMSPTMLGDNQAQVATNVKLYSRELRYWRGNTWAATPAIANVQTIYKYYTTGDPAWLAWDKDVDIVRSPITDTVDFRLYYTGDGVPKKTNAALALSGLGPYPAASLNLGVAAPLASLTPTRVGSTDYDVTTAETRIYVYTKISTFGSLSEESAPSPVSNQVTVYSGDSVSLAGFPTSQLEGENVTALRIYRSVTGATTDSFLFVKEIPFGTATTDDTLGIAELGEALPTLGWDAPVDDLAGLVALPNGSLAGFSGNTVYFSEPFYPHAWPAAYALNIPDRIIGLGVYAMSVVVMTDRNPYIISGSGPGAFSVERVPMLEPCVSKRSITSDEFGVLYASPNGMVGIGPSVRSVVTAQLFRRDEWQARQPSLIAGAIMDGRYFAIYPTANASQQAMVISRDDIPALSNIDINATAVHVDSRTAKLYFADATDGKIYEADSNDLSPLSYLWRSKRFVLPHAATWSALKLDGVYSDVEQVDAYNASVQQIIDANKLIFAQPLEGALNEAPLNARDVNGSILQNVPPLAEIRTAKVTLYAEGIKFAELDVTSFSPVRIPPFKARDVEIEIEGNINVRSVRLATTVSELYA